MSRKLRTLAIVIAIAFLPTPRAFAECEDWTCWRTSADTGECRLSFNIGTYAASCTVVHDCPPWNPEGPCGIWCEYNNCYDV